MARLKMNYARMVLEGDTLLGSGLNAAILRQAGGGSKHKTELERALQGSWHGRKVGLMKGKAASAVGSCSDIHPLRVDIQICSIT
jgi:hypothetical protein